MDDRWIEVKPVVIYLQLGLRGYHSRCCHMSHSQGRRLLTHGTEQLYTEVFQAQGMVQEGCSEYVKSNSVLCEYIQCECMYKY